MNSAQAIYWFQQAADQGIAEAQEEVIKEQEKERRRKEEAEWEEGIRSGTILFSELLAIESAITESRENLKLFLEKFDLFQKWMDCPTSSGGQADVYWDQAHYLYGCSPLNAIRKHKFTECCSRHLSKLKKIQKIRHESQVRLLIEDVEKIISVQGEAMSVQRRAWS